MSLWNEVINIHMPIGKSHMIQGIRETKLIAAIIGGAGLFILIHALLSPESPSGSMADMGSFSGTSMILATMGASMFTGGFVYFLFGGERDRHSSPIQNVAPSYSSNAEETRSQSERTVTSPLPADRKEREFNLIIRLLDGDERTIFRTIVESGGEALQKDLIVRTKMSDAKVSRVLDRLEGMDLITKERYGSTNRIGIKTEEKD
jgi:DNA-binding transcriptional ArsR family regulator